ncbi:MAG TPA: hypothetical protein VG455_13020 [Acidimicrobiales bacterium]|nr:hypothetical protein [Acidimicrobiales bacterium]
MELVPGIAALVSIAVPLLAGLFLAAYFHRKNYHEWVSRGFLYGALAILVLALLLIPLVQNYLENKREHDEWRACVEEIAVETNELFAQSECTRRQGADGEDPCEKDPVTGFKPPECEVIVP